MTHISPVFYGTCTTHLCYVLARVISPTHSARERQLSLWIKGSELGAVTEAAHRCLEQGMRNPPLLRLTSQRGSEPLQASFPDLPPQVFIPVGN